MTQIRQLAAIMFTDIVGYTALMEEDERLAFSLLEKNRSIQKPIIEKYNGRWLKEMGDGVLASFSSVTDAVYCAIAIQKACFNENDLKLRIGINQGEVVFDESDVFGEGVNLASRLETLAPVGGILISESVHNNIINKTDIDSAFVGQRKLKNVQKPVNVYQVYIERGTHQHEVRKQPKSFSPVYSIPAVKLTLLVLVAIGAVTLFFYFPGSKNNSDTTGIMESAVAVMPFRNDSEDPENIYFCNSMMEDVIGQLSRIEDMRVPSITSMLYYRDNPKPYSEIVQELKVTHLLEGSVRKMEDKVLMNLALIDASDNRQIWTNRYNMDLSVKELWEMQFELAKQITYSLRLVLSSDDHNEEIPTENFRAYDNYLQARDLIRKWSIPENRKAVNLLREAITLDPGFHLGFAELAMALCQKTDLTGSPGVDSARSYAEQSLALRANSPQALAAAGYYLGMKGNPDSALALFNKAVLINPMVSYNFAGWCYWQLGDYEKAINEHLNIFYNDPNNPVLYIDFAFSSLSLGLFDESVVFSKKAYELSPGIMWVTEHAAKTEYYRGNYRESLSGFSSSTAVTTGLWKGMNLIKLGDFQQARFHLEKFLVQGDSLQESAFLKLNHYTARALMVYLNYIEGETAYGRNSMLKLIEEINVELTDKFPAKYALLAGCYASLGMVDECTDRLQVGIGSWWDYHFIKQFPLFEPIKESPDFKRVMNQINNKTTQAQQRISAQGNFKQALMR